MKRKASTLARKKQVKTKPKGKEADMKQSFFAGMKRVKFEIKAEPKSEVFIAGSFNNWNPRKNKLSCRNGVFSTSLLIPKGRHEYKFIVNDTWCVDPTCSEWAPNGLGSLNSVINVN